MDSKSTRSFGALSGSTAFTRRSSDYIQEKGIREEEDDDGSVEKATRSDDLSPSLPVLLNSDSHHSQSTSTSTTKRGSVFKQFFNRSSPSSSSSPKNSSKFDLSDQLPAAASSSRREQNSVPATPSLLNALDRVNAAQRQARGGGQPQDHPVVDEQRTTMSEERRAGSSRASMDEFWKSVIDKSEGR